MNTKHTPGPWEVFIAEDSFFHGIDAPTKSIVMYGEDHDDLGGVLGSTKEEAEANARLIAAAPELLEALIDCVAFLLEKDCNNRILQNAQAAIKKATE